jgi:hypothetical protein
MGPKVVLRWTDDEDEQNDEVCRVYLNGDLIFTLTHDAHGWDGMVGALDLVAKLAEHEGWQVETVGESGV